MQKFITKSPSSKKILKSVRLSTNLPVNTLISGEIGVGKKLLASEILPNSTSLNAKELEKLIILKQIDLNEYKSLILYDLHLVINIEELLNQLTNIKLVVTSLEKHEKYNNKFAIKIDIPSLDKRQEDLNEIISIYTKEAAKIYNTNEQYQLENLHIDLSGNGITLKQSIHKSILLQSMTKQDMISTLETYFYNQLKNDKTYKQLLEVFEIPLLKASKKAFKSQLKISKQLSINRITLSKKLHNYFGEA